MSVLKPTKPYTFTSGSLGKSAEVNSDFDTLYSKVSEIIDELTVLSLATVGISEDNVKYASDFASVNAAITAIGGTPTTFVVDTTTATTGAAVFPETTSVRVGRAGSITANHNVTFNGAFAAGPHTVFTGAGVITFGKGSTSFILPQWRGSKLDGSTTDTTNFQTTLDELPEGAVLWINNGCILKAGTCTLKQKKVTITGGGTIDATIEVTAPAARIAGNHLDMFTHIIGLTFHNLSSRASVPAIQLVNARRGYIGRNQFFGFEDAVKVAVNLDGTAWGGHVSRWTLAGNTYGVSADEDTNSPNVDYFFRILDSYSHGASFSVGDVNVLGNEGTADVSHVCGDSVDGITIADNVFFSLPNSTTKSEHIILTYCAWANIHDNKLWEPGLEGVKLVQTSRYNIHDNMIAWAGVRLEAAAIKVTGTPLSGAYYGQGTIHDNNIVEPTGHGIHLDAKEGRTTVYQNHIWYPGRADRYYGVPALSGTQKLIITDADTVDLTVKNNFGNNGTYSLAPGGASACNVNENNVIDQTNSDLPFTIPNTTIGKTLTGTETNTTVDREHYVNFAQSGATNFTKFNLSSTYFADYVYKTFTIQAYNGNTTLVHGANLLLKGSANVTLAATNYLTFQIHREGGDTYAIEIGRNF